MPTAVLPERPTVPELLDKLEALGDHKAIALHLSSLGIKGFCQDAGRCPIAVYLQQETGNDEIHVGDDTVAIWNGALPADAYKIPPAVKDFIAFFDARFHPELMELQIFKYTAPA